MVDALPAGAPIPEYARPLLEGTPIAFMTTMRPDGMMSTNPVSLLFDGTHVQVSTCTNRRKHRNLLADDRVTICVVQPGNLNRYLEIRGRAVIEPDLDRGFINRMARQYMDADEYPFDRPGDQRVVITVIAEKVSSPRIPMADDPPYS